MRKFRLKRKFFICILLILLPFTASGRTYRIATVAWMGWSPLHVASEKGYWDGLGVDVQVITYDDPIIILEAIKANHIDFAMDMVGSLVGVYMAGEPVVAIAETNWSHGGDKIIVRKGDRLENHVGGVIGVFLHKPSCLYFLGQYLRQINQKLSDFRVVEINPRDLSAQFIAGRLPAIVNYEPWAKEAVIEGNGSVLATSRDFGGCIPECLWGYRESLKNIRDEDIQNIIAGWIKAIQWVKKPANRSEYYKILRDHTFKNEMGLTEGDISRMLSEVSIHGMSELRERNKDNGGMYRFLVSMESFLKHNGLLKKSFSPRDIFENQYIMKVLETMSH